MTRAAEAARSLLWGSARVMAAEALILPTGLVLVAFLTDRFGAAGYGRYAAVAGIGAAFEVSAAAIFARATISLVGEREDWRPAGGTVLRVHLVAGLLAGAGLAVAAGPIGAGLGDPAVAGDLRLFAVEVPLFVFAYGHRSLLVGIGHFGRRAALSAVRWVARLGAVVAFVAAGLSVRGAILGMIAASVAELALARLWVHPPVLSGPRIPLRRVWEVTLPLAGAAIGLQIFDKLDLLMVKALVEPAQAGFYGAALNVALVPVVLGSGMTPLLQSALAGLLRDGEERTALSLARGAIRLGFWLLPLVAVASGSAAELVAAIFPPRFAPAVTPLSLLLIAAWGVSLLSMTFSVLVAAGRSAHVLGIVATTVVLSAGGYAVAVPAAGLAGAAWVTLVAAAGAAAVGVASVERCWPGCVAFATAGRAAAVAAGAFVVARAWQSSGVMLVVELASLGTLALAALAMLGEAGRAERDFLRGLVARAREVRA